MCMAFLSYLQTLDLTCMHLQPVFPQLFSSFFSFYLKMGMVLFQARQVKAMEWMFQENYRLWYCESSLTLCHVLLLYILLLWSLFAHVSLDLFYFCTIINLFFLLLHVVVNCFVLFLGRRFLGVRKMLIVFVFFSFYWFFVPFKRLQSC